MYISVCSMYDFQQKKQGLSWQENNGVKYAKKRPEKDFNYESRVIVELSRHRNTLKKK